MLILNSQVNSSSVFVSFFIVIKNNSLANFNLIYFQLWTKKTPLKSQFSDFEVLWWKFAKFLMLFHKPQVSFSSNFASLSSIMKDDSSLLFLVKHYCKAPIKGQIFETFECSDQNSSNSCHFWNSKSVLLQFFYQSWVASNITSLYFPSWSIIYFRQMQPVKEQIFEIFKCSGQDLLSSSCQFWTSQFLFKFCIFLHCHNT